MNERISAITGEAAREKTGRKLLMHIAPLQDKTDYLYVILEWMRLLFMRMTGESSGYPGD